LELDAPEVRRRRVEDKPVRTRFQGVREAGDASIVVGRALRDELRLAKELDAHSARRFALPGVEDMRRERGGHAGTLRLESAPQPGERLRPLRALELAEGRQ